MYWIPGAFEPKAATPIPKDEGSMVVRDTDLIFLPAYRAVGHAVLLGPATKGERGMQLVAQLHGDANVAQLNEPLEIEEEIKVDDDDGPELAARAANLQP